MTWHGNHLSVHVEASHSRADNNASNQTAEPAHHMNRNASGEINGTLSK
eukprot:CAMPEP_0184696092 /NCGR_PEP_ID=MMETSP0313-20130426/3507_1 /TAXON_ID=2792 /ORGANISM="Porphyridium aerugineum, Strain SAG 1380-2" /LENGTH=48 /DNA_ID= /DNA_START= /DNA_END= /DNA_ORIENTATION=